MLSKSWLANVYTAIQYYVFRYIYILNDELNIFPMYFSFIFLLLSVCLCLQLSYDYGYEIH